jgi:hypothetical protein
MKGRLLSRRTRIALIVGLVSVVPAGLVFSGQAIPNWAAPATWTPSGAVGLHTLSDVTSPLPFTGITPCRVADTRGNGFTGQYGPPSLVANANRNFTIAGQCGIPSGASAVSFNFAALNVGATGDLRVFPAGGATPLVSTMNYNAATPNIANAAIVPLGSGGAITVRADAVSVDLIIDVNGYYAIAAANQSNTFEVDTSAPWAITGKTGSSADLATGVLGQAWAPTGNTIGVWGETFSVGNGARGVMGYAQGGVTGKTFGVEGLTLSTANNAAGVYGMDGSGDPDLQGYLSAGIRGASTANYGVLGISRDHSAIKGVSVNSSGTQQTIGYLGFDATFGVYAIGQIGASGAKPFIEPHPTDATREIAYVALEGPEAGTYFRGRGRIQNGTGIIEVPESFRLVSDEDGLTVQITPIGQAVNVAVISADLNTITVRSSAKNLEFYYVVNGVRKAFKDWEVITENRHYVPEGPEAKMPGAFAPEQRRRLIATGIYNEDGTVNLETAERLGWAKAWRDRDEQAKAAAAASRASRDAKSKSR